MDKSALEQEASKIKTRLLIILIALFTLFINVVFVIRSTMKRHIENRIPDFYLIYNINLETLAITIFSIFVIATYITYIYKFKKLSMNITNYQKSINENKDEDFILIYKNYRSVKITEALFYIIAISIYMYLLFITLQML